MPETRLELGVPPADKAPRAHAFVPLQWFRRRRTLLACIAFFACALLYLHAAAPASRWHPYRRPAGDADIDALLRTVPGAVPGRDVVVTDVLADAGHAGRPYPTREHLRLVLLEQLRDPTFTFAASPWPQWAPWVADDAKRPRDAHVQFLMELKRLGNGTDDARLVRVPLTQFLEHPAHWAERHRQTTPFTVFSKSYCPYSRRAKALLDTYRARYAAYEVDLHPESAFFTQLLWDLTGHRTYPKVLEGAHLLVRGPLTQGGSDALDELDRKHLLHGILDGAGVL
ncbi:hypothetical protein MBRA1_003941 [Malassezia brasiliensis]|uniref:Glutaredoxin domain-containing protein n=1 Tax=Malassezia brasiliensis TaxID=1821822 RepID=A0AAF0IQE3_9BASI|nr:hypothetical protein MBRA1_003941 [Malassezia brasiliensis]